MTRLEYPIVVEPLPAEEGGGFLATAPDLPGCMSDGATPEEAVSNIQDAILAWIEAARDLGHAVPKPSRRAAVWMAEGAEHGDGAAVARTLPRSGRSTAASMEK